MERLRELYAQLLSVGFVVLRQAVDANDIEWAAKEIDLLHNVPSLIDEPNVERHRYYWQTEREHYLDWVSSPGRERANSRMQTYYAPVWREMEPCLLQICPSCLGEVSPVPADGAQA
jgi:hypothetical protein